MRFAKYIYIYIFKNTGANEAQGLTQVSIPTDCPWTAVLFSGEIRSTIEGGRGCNKCVPVLRGNGTKIAPTGYIFDQPPGGMSWVRGKLAGHVGGHVVLSPEEGVLVTSPGTESSYPRPSQFLNNSRLPMSIQDW